MTKIRIPKHIAQLGTYKPGKAVADVFEGRNLKRKSVLSSNENNLGPSPKAIASIQKVLWRLHEYPDPTNHELRQALSQKTEVPVEGIMVGNGSDSLLSCLFQEFFEGDDSVLTSEGTFMTVSVMAARHQVPMVKVAMTGAYAFDLERILQTIDTTTRVIYLCNPNNPTGTIIPKTDLNLFLEKVPSEILVVIDEAYFEYASHLSEEYPDSTRLGFENVLTYRTFSKVYGLGGMRLGYVMGAPYLIEALKKVRLTFEPSNVAQASGIGALADEDFKLHTLETNKKGLATISQVLGAFGNPGIQGFGNFIFCPFSNEKTANHTFDGLFERGVFVRKLGFFGFPFALRISTGTPQEMEHFRDALKDL